MNKGLAMLKELVGDEKLHAVMVAIKEGLTVERPKLHRDPKEMDRDLIFLLMPELKFSTVPRDQVRLAAACEMVWKWRDEYLTEMRGVVMELRERDKERDALLKEGLALHKEQEVTINGLKADLHACQEGRGTWESKIKTELEAKIAKQNLDVEEAKRNVREANETSRSVLDSTKNLVAELRAEVAAKDASVAGYKRDLEQVSTAAARNATLVQSALTFLTSTRDNLVDRYGAKGGPFIDTVIDGISTAITTLPK